LSFSEVENVLKDFVDLWKLLFRFEVQWFLSASKPFKRLESKQSIAPIFTPFFKYIE
jgi:hypothetical protein